MGMFTKALKTERKLRMAITGPSGTGKTYTALLLAQALGSRIALIDTEHGGSTLYADEFDFDYVALDSFSPEAYIKYLQGAAREHYPVVIVDTISHAWMGKDGTLEIVDKHAAKQRGENRFTAWQVGTKKHTEFVEALLSVPFHLIVTMRSKMDYAMDRDGDKTKITKLGLAPVQREGIEYEFDVIGDMDLHHTMTITKSRLRLLSDRVIATPGIAFGQEILAALSEGVVVTPGTALAHVGQLLRQYVSPTGHTGLRNAILYQAFEVDTPEQVKYLPSETITRGLPTLRWLCTQLPISWDGSLAPQTWVHQQMQQLPPPPEGFDPITGAVLEDLPDGWATAEEAQAQREREEALLLAQAETA